MKKLVFDSCYCRFYKQCLQATVLSQDEPVEEKTKWKDKELKDRKEKKEKKRNTGNHYPQKW